MRVAPLREQALHLHLPVPYVYYRHISHGSNGGGAATATQNATAPRTAASCFLPAAEAVEAAAEENKNVKIGHGS